MINRITAFIITLITVAITRYLCKRFDVDFQSAMIYSLLYTQIVRNLEAKDAQAKA